MIKFLYFSDYIRPFLHKVRFAFIVIGRFLKILFRRKKGISLLHLDYTRENQFHNGYLIIHYRFKNALWYNFKNLKKTTDTHPVVFDLRNLEKKDITLVVYGFFQKRVCHIDILPRKILESKSFATIISGINQEPTLATTFKLRRKTVFLSLPKINAVETTILINHSFYNQTDFT